MPNWEVIYKATADFHDLTKAAAEARTELKQLQEASDRETTAEAKGALAAAAAHREDTKAINDQRQAMEKAAAVAEIYNRMVNYGGRTSMDQHLSDVQRELQQTTLLQRARQRGFYTPQQDYSFRQQEIAQRRLLNYANQQGYATGDQYLSFLDSQRKRMDAENQSWARRAVLLKQNTDMAVAHANATAGTALSAGQLAGANLGSGSDAAVALADTGKAATDMKTKVKDATSSAARDEEALAQKSKSSSSKTKEGWESAGTAILGVLRRIVTNARTASQDGETAFQKMALGIRNAFSGGGGSGIADVFQGMGDAISGVAAEIPGKVTLITSAILALIQILPAAAAGLGALGSVAATLPDFLGAAGGAFITFQAAIMPVIDALQKFTALEQAREAVSAGGIQATMQQAQAFHALADAQFAATQAVVTGANQQITAAHNVAEAQFNLKQAYFTASMQQVQSAMSVATALHGLQNAQFAVTQAQFQLNMAWIQAQRSLQDLEIQVGLASLNLRGAQLSLAEAQQNYAQVMANSTSTALDRAQAAYQIQQAEASLAQVQLQNKRNEQDLQNVRKYGIKQYYGVTAAQHALTDAQFQQVQAQKQLMITQKEAANAQIVAAHQIADAVFALHQAYFDQGQAAVTSAHAISDAQFQVSQSQKQLALDAQAGGAAAVSAYNAFQVALAQLSPAAKKAVQDLEPLFVWWQNNKAAQQAFFGAVGDNLAALGKGGANLIRPLNTMLTAIAGALGNVAGKFLDWFVKLANSPLWTLFTKTSVTIVKDVGDGLLSLAKAFTSIAVAAAPLTDWLVKHFMSWAKDFEKWANSSLKPGSMLHKLLAEAPSALQAVYQLLKSIIIFFGILAGGTPTFNKQGVLTGLIPSDSQNNAFQTFLKLLASLSNTILPNLAILLNDLARPAVANALINLLNALSILLVQVVNSPGFLAAFNTFLTIFVGFVDALSYLVQHNSVLGNVLGAIAGGLVAISVLKFTGVVLLAKHIKDIAGWVKDIKGAPGLLGKIGAALGMGGGTTATAAGGMQGAADTMTTAAAAMQDAADTMITAAGKEQVAADTQGAAGAGGGAAGAAVKGGGFVAALRALLGGGELAGGVGALFAAGHIPSLTGHGSILSADLKGLGSALPGGKDWNTAYRELTRFSNSLSAIPKSFKVDWKAATASAATDWQLLSSSAAQDWHDLAASPIGHFFGTDIPNYFNNVGSGWSGLWSQAWNFIGSKVFDRMSNFFSVGIASDFVDAWNNFQTKLLHPMAEWAANALPSSIQGGFKTAVNWVITNVINRVFGWINDATKIVGIPALKPIQRLAAGGMAGFPGIMGKVGGGGTGDTQPALLTPGEWIVREPAARAITRRFGHGAMDQINQADRILGMAGGGSVPGGGGGLGGFLGNVVGDIGGFLGGIGRKILGSGAKVAVDQLFGHLINPLLSHLGINSQTEATGVLPHIVGFLSADLQKGLTSFLTSAGSTSGGGKFSIPGNLPRGGNAAANLAIGRSLASRFGWGGGNEWAALVNLWMGESGWNNYAYNPNGGATGIPQSLPYSKMPRAAWLPFQGGQANAGAQIMWGLEYIKNNPNYGDPARTYALWLSRSPHWYASGGEVNPGGPMRSDPWVRDWTALSAAFGAESHHARSMLKFAPHARRLQGRLARAFAAIAAHHGQPSSINSAAWARLSGDTSALAKHLHGKRDHRLLPLLHLLARAEGRAQRDWGGLGFHTPGPTGAPPPIIGVGSVPDIMSMIGVGPALPSYADGGMVDPFGFGSVPGLSYGMSALPASYSTPARSMSSAGAAMATGPSSGGGLHIGDVTINNPVQEPAGESLTRATQRLAFMAGRGFA